MRLREEEIIDEFTNQKDSLTPLVVKSIEEESNLISKYGIDAIIKFSIQGGSSFVAAVEVLPVSTPKIISDKSKILKNFAPEYKTSGLIPMIIAPYISEKKSQLLLDEGISWIDLSGNMLVKASSNIYIERMGKPNKFPDTSPIKNIYRGTSSLVSRALLLNTKDCFSSLNEIMEFVNNRNATITTATISKVLKSLEEDLLIKKQKSSITVEKPQQLLENLVDSYDLERKSNREYKYDVENINELSAVLDKSNIDYAFCRFYAAQIKNLGIAEQITIFIKSIQDVKRALKNNGSIAVADDEYGQVTFIETKNPCVWFNLEKTPSGNVVDNLELYLELVNDRPRGPKIAEQLKQQILEKYVE